MRFTGEIKRKEIIHRTVGTLSKVETSKTWSANGERVRPSKGLERGKMRRRTEQRKIQVKTGEEK